MLMLLWFEHQSYHSSERERESLCHSWFCCWLHSSSGPLRLTLYLRPLPFRSYYKVLSCPSKTSFSAFVSKSTTDLAAFVQPKSFIPTATNVANLQYAHVPATGSAGCNIFYPQATNFSWQCSMSSSVQGAKPFVATLEN